MLIKSFGCSFIFGNDLPDTSGDTASNLTWPALVAKKLSVDYQCYAQGGSGNFQILKRILHHAATDVAQDVFYIIGWTWMDRFDYIESSSGTNNWKEHWQTITPTTKSRAANFYYKNFHSELNDKLSSLINIRSAVDILEQKRIRFLMTFMDNLIFDRQWHAPNAVVDCQDRVRPYLHTFDDVTFLEWSKEKGFPISETLHPLKAAHVAGAELMLPKVRDLLDTSSVL